MDADQLKVDVLDAEIDAMDPADQSYVKRLRELSKLCGDLGCLPRSYALNDELIISGQYAESSGGFSDVYKAQYGDGWVAVKALRLHAGDRVAIKKAFCHEVTHWKRLNHPHIVRFLGTSSKFYLSIVSEWMINGDLLSYLELHPETQRLQLITQVASAIEYMHSSQVVHGDIKGRNILINSHGQACLSDFGLAVAVYRTQSLNALSSMTGPSASPGTIRWSAPERLMPTDDPRYTTPTMASDVYSFGITMWEVYTTRVPFNNLPQDWLVIPQILKGSRPMRSKSIPSSVWLLMEACWTHERRDRPISADISMRLQEELAFEVSSAHLRAPPLDYKTLPAPEDRCYARTDVPNWFSRSGIAVKHAIFGGPTRLFLDVIAPGNVLFVGCNTEHARRGGLNKQGHFTENVQPKELIRRSQERLAKCDSNEWTHALSGLFCIMERLRCPVCRSEYTQVVEKSTSTERSCRSLVQHIASPRGSSQRLLALIYSIILSCFSSRLKNIFISCNIVLTLEAIQQHVHNASSPDISMLSVFAEASILFKEGSFEASDVISRTLSNERCLLIPTEFVTLLGWIGQTSCQTTSALEILFLVPPVKVWDRYDTIGINPSGGTVKMFWESAARSPSPLSRAVLRYLLSRLYELSCWTRQPLEGEFEGNLTADILWKTLWMPLLYARVRYRWHTWYARGAFLARIPPIRPLLSTKLQLQLDALCQDSGLDAESQWYMLLVEVSRRQEGRLLSWLELALAEMDPAGLTSVAN